MGEPKAPHPVKLLIGLLAQREAWLAAAEAKLAARFGPIDLASEIIPFDFTEYYTPEMGPNLLRKFVTHDRLVSPGDLAAIKLATNAMEEELAREFLPPEGLIPSGGYPEGQLSTAPARPISRPVNLDPGYLDGSKLILATTKDYTHRIYLRDGIYGEVTLTWRKGAYAATPWTYKDYTSAAYLAFFAKAGARYLAQLRPAAPARPTIGRIGPIRPIGPTGSAREEGTPG